MPPGRCARQPRWRGRSRRQRLPGAGLVQGYGCRDRDDEPRRTRYESNEGVVPREEAVLDDELDCLGVAGLLFGCETIGVAREDAGRDSLDGVIGAEEHRPDDKGGAADSRRGRVEAVEQPPDARKTNGVRTSCPMWTKSQRSTSFLIPSNGLSPPGFGWKTIITAQSGPA